MNLVETNKSKYLRAMTLIEILVAMAVIVIVFVAVVPQLRSIQNSWASKRENSEIIQNGRALLDHIIFNLMQARRITAVSAPAETNGYIEFKDNQSTIMRYQIGANNYIQFGQVGNLADLAGPVSSLQFTCYDAYDLDTTITDVNDVRCVNVETTFTNAEPLGEDKTFTAQAYLRTNYLSGALSLCLRRPRR